MNFSQAKLILEKINRLYKTMNLDTDNIDVFEQDLMLSYIRQLQDAFSPKIQNSTSAPRTIPTVEKVTKPAPRIIREEVPPTPPPAPRIIETPVEAAPVSRPVVVETPPPPPPPVVEEPVYTPPPAPVVREVVTPQPVATRSSATAEFEELFEQNEARELSEKLGESPIKDLSKAMGLNEKILTINELFGGNKESFNSTLTLLNSMSNFEDAKNHLANKVAIKFNWAGSKEKTKLAKNFVKLVRRRYK